jgi:hypothetical protein
MKEYYLAVLTSNIKREEFISMMLTDLVREGKAVEGFDGNKRTIMEILYDKNDNPCLLFETSKFNEVSEELQKRGIFPKYLVTISKFLDIFKITDENSYNSLNKTFNKNLYNICFN